MKQRAQLIYKAVYLNSGYLSVLLVVLGLIYCMAQLNLTHLYNAPLSYYGSFVTTKLVFNTAFILSGMLNFLFAHQIIEKMQYQHKSAKATIFYLSAIGSVGMALFPVPLYRDLFLARFVHNFFAGLNVYLYTIGFAIVIKDIYKRYLKGNWKSGELRWLRKATMITVAIAIIGVIGNALILLLRVNFMWLELWALLWGGSASLYFWTNVRKL